jgi:hypothetical protein
MGQLVVTTPVVAQLLADINVEVWHCQLCDLRRWDDPDVKPKGSCWTQDALNHALEHAQREFSDKWCEPPTFVPEGICVCMCVSQVKSTSVRFTPMRKQFTSLVP